MRQLSEEWKEDNEVHTSDVLKKEKVENKESDNRRMENITHGLTDMRRTLKQSKKPLLIRSCKKRVIEKEIAS